MGEVDLQTLANYKEITKHELETSAKTLRLQNTPLEKDEVVSNVVTEILAPILQISLQEFFIRNWPCLQSPYGLYKESQT